MAAAPPRAAAFLLSAVLLLVGAQLAHGDAGSTPCSITVKPGASGADLQAALNAAAPHPRRRKWTLNQPWTVCLPSTSQIFLTKPLVFPNNTVLRSATNATRGNGGSSALPASSPSISGGAMLRFRASGTGHSVARVPAGMRILRQLYADGMRVVRDRVASASLQALFAHAAVGSVGYKVPRASIVQTWSRNPVQASTIEFVYTAPKPCQWTESRCTVLNVTDISSTETMVYMKQPCFSLLVDKPCGQGWTAPTAVENSAGNATMLRQGEWYFDAVGQQVVLAGAPPSSSAVAPVLQTLAVLTGAENVTVDGIAWEHATWHRPSEDYGYVEQQSGAMVNEPNSVAGCNSSKWEPMPGHVVVRASRTVAFRRCTFRHLGAVAVQVHEGSHHTSIDRCVFTDVSGAAVQLGDYNTWGITDPARQDRHNTVSNSLIDGVATEYHGNCGLQAGYTAHTTFAHNELRNLPYGGITIGWGWARVQHSYAANNSLLNNHVHNFKSVLGDGGGLYALGPQPGSTMAFNWVDNMRAGKGGGGYYPDEGSAYWNIHHNVFGNATYCTDNCQWLHIWTSSIHDINVTDCYSDTKTQDNKGRNTVERDITYVPPHAPWPPAAQKIMHNAGIPQN